MSSDWEDEGIAPEMSAVEKHHFKFQDELAMYLIGANFSTDHFSTRKLEFSGTAGQMLRLAAEELEGLGLCASRPDTLDHGGRLSGIAVHISNKIAATSRATALKLTGYIDDGVESDNELYQAVMRELSIYRGGGE